MDVETQRQSSRAKIDRSGAYSMWKTDKHQDCLTSLSVVIKSKNRQRYPVRMSKYPGRKRPETLQRRSLISNHAPSASAFSFKRQVLLVIWLRWLRRLARRGRQDPRGGMSLLNCLWRVLSSEMAEGDARVYVKPTLDLRTSAGMEECASVRRSRGMAGGCASRQDGQANKAICTKDAGDYCVNAGAGPACVFTLFQ